MADQHELKKCIKSNCPLLWSLLRTKAQQDLPKGLIKYIDAGAQTEIETGRNNLATVERYLTSLKNLCGWKIIGDNYRKALSGVGSENQVAELFCEIALCASLGEVSGNLQLHPPTGKGTFSDCLINLHGFDICCEAKRYADPWPYNIDGPFSRSIAQRPATERPHDSDRPRSMDIRKKLRDTHRQFPESGLNILFVFHSSLGESKRYLTQALFGDSNFSATRDDPVLKSDGLFSIEEWRNISACCLTRANPTSEVIFPFTWKNPRALLEIPQPVLKAFT